MKLRQFVKNRWLELRIGASTYFSYLVAFVSLVLLISVKFPDTGILTYVVFAILLSSGEIAIGHFHLKVQQTTDVKLQFGWLKEETAKEVVRLLKEEKLV